MHTVVKYQLSEQRRKSNWFWKRLSQKMKPPQKNTRSVFRVNGGKGQPAKGPPGVKKSGQLQKGTQGEVSLKREAPSPATTSQVRARKLLSRVRESQQTVMSKRTTVVSAGDDNIRVVIPNVRLSTHATDAVVTQPPSLLSRRNPCESRLPISDTLRKHREFSRTGKAPTSQEILDEYVGNMGRSQSVERGGGRKGDAQPDPKRSASAPKQRIRAIDALGEVVLSLEKRIHGGASGAPIDKDEGNRVDVEKLYQNEEKFWSEREMSLNENIMGEETSLVRNDKHRGSDVPGPSTTSPEPNKRLKISLQKKSLDVCSHSEDLMDAIAMADHERSTILEEKKLYDRVFQQRLENNANKALSVIDEYKGELLRNKDRASVLYTRLESLLSRQERGVASVSDEEMASLSHDVEAITSFKIPPVPKPKFESPVERVPIAGSHPNNVARIRELEERLQYVESRNKQLEEEYSRSRRTSLDASGQLNENVAGSTPVTTAEAGAITSPDAQSANVVSILRDEVATWQSKAGELNAQVNALQGRIRSLTEQLQEERKEGEEKLQAAQASYHATLQELAGDPSISRPMGCLKEAVNATTVRAVQTSFIESSSASETGNVDASRRSSGMDLDIELVRKRIFEENERKEKSFREGYQKMLITLKQARVKENEMMMEKHEAAIRDLNEEHNAKIRELNTVHDEEKRSMGRRIERLKMDIESKCSHLEAECARLKQERDHYESRSLNSAEEVKKSLEYELYLQRRDTEKEMLAKCEDLEYKLLKAKETHDAEVGKLRREWANDVEVREKEWQAQLEVVREARDRMEAQHAVVQSQYDTVERSFREQHQSQINALKVTHENHAQTIQLQAQQAQATYERVIAELKAEISTQRRDHEQNILMLRSDYDLKLSSLRSAYHKLETTLRGPSSSIEPDVPLAVNSKIPSVRVPAANPPEDSSAMKDGGSETNNTHLMQNSSPGQRKLSLAEAAAQVSSRQDDEDDEAATAAAAAESIAQAVILTPETAVDNDPVAMPTDAENIRPHAPLVPNVSILDLSGLAAAVTKHDIAVGTTPTGSQSLFYNELTAEAHNIVAAAVDDVVATAVAAANQGNLEPGDSQEQTGASTDHSRDLGAGGITRMTFWPREEHTKASVWSPGRPKVETRYGGADVRDVGSGEANEPLPEAKDGATEISLTEPEPRMTIPVPSPLTAEPRLLLTPETTAGAKSFGEVQWRARLRNDPSLSNVSTASTGVHSEYVVIGEAMDGVGITSAGSLVFTPMGTVNPDFTSKERYTELLDQYLKKF